jgi:cardiolipin synthase
MEGIHINIEPAQSGSCGFSDFLTRRFNNLRGIALLIVVLPGLSSCASLPDAAEDRAVPHAQQVEFEGVDGQVAEVRSDAIIVQLQGKASGADILDKHLAYEQAVNIDSPLVLGNKLTLLQNGPDTYEAMYVAIRAATDSINLETYIFDDDVIGNHFSDLLLERQSAGVQVNVIYDSFGGLTTSATFFDRLRDGGINVLEFNPLNPLSGNQDDWSLNNRDHRKQLIVDGRIVFVGGVNISETYSSTPLGMRAGKIRKRPHGEDTSWRDMHIRIEGPVVTEFQKLFMDTWAQQNGAALAERNYFPELKAVGDEIVRAIGSSPTDPDSLIYLTLMSAISHAELKIHIANAYFAPDPEFLQALIDAAQRGVDVKLILPSYSDSQAVFHLGRSHYTKLLRGGVRIYERRGAMMHVKTVSIDDVWSTIGSSNLDMRSFLHNDEINAVILGRGFAAQMEGIFADDLIESEQILLEKWQRRSLLLRFKEHVARLGEYWL